MEDTANSDLMVELAELLEEHKAGDVVVLDISRQSSWTDYFVICTVNSNAHLRGLVRSVNGFLAFHKIEALNKRKHVSEDGWMLIDCGTFVIHLMTRKLRDFYELERLWFSGEAVYHSSKSS